MNTEKGPDWVPANRGSEEPTVTRTGHRVLWCMDTVTRRCAYIDLDTDTEIENDMLDAYGLGI